MIADEYTYAYALYIYNNNTYMCLLYLFLIDIITIFNTAYIDDDFEIVQSRKKIASQYLKGWFTIDIFAIIPLEHLTGSDSVNQMVRFSRMGRLFKIVKMSKLLRLFKLIKDNKKLKNFLQSILSVGFFFDRMIMLALISTILCHLVACLWLIMP